MIALSAVTISRVSRGANTRPMVKPVAIQTSRQNGQVISSPIECRRPPVERTSSITSAGPPVSWYRVNGARSGLVTASLVSVRESLWVPAASRSTSHGPTPAGSFRPVASASPAAPDTSAANTAMTTT